MNGFLIKFEAPDANGVMKVVRVGNTTNTNPTVESAGLGFDNNNVLNILFVNGTMSTVNLTTGALGTLQANALATSNNNLRGDLASMLPQSVTPVTFGTFSATTSGNNLTVNWNTVSETNNKDL